jgi:hypothetical protein
LSRLKLRKVVMPMRGAVIRVLQVGCGDQSLNAKKRSYSYAALFDW